MQNVLADLCMESEAATITAARLARACDEAPNDPEATLFKRLAPAVSKYWICKSAVWHVAEALECFGGNGYVEESRHAADLPRDAAQLDLGGLRATSTASTCCARW